MLVKEELAPLILPDSDDVSAVRFDALMLGLELAQLAGNRYGRLRIDLYKKVSGIASVANIPEIQNQKELIEKILQTDYVDHAGIEDFEHIRKQLRDLIKYIPKVKLHYETDFTDNILSSEWNESELENDELKNYKAKAEYYIRKHQDNIVIAKLKNNKPLTSTDVEALEDILWKEVGTREDYEKEYGHKPLGEFVRIYNVATEQIHAHLITEEVMQQFRQKQAIFRDTKKVPIDNLAGHIALVFELEFPQSYEIVKEQGYLDRLLAFQSPNEGLMLQFQEMRQIMQEHLQAMAEKNRQTV